MMSDGDIKLKTLAIESSGTSASVALFAGRAMLRTATLARDVRSAQGLAPLIRAELAAANWQPGDVNLIAVTSGPGSFTGLRVGVTTAKSLAYALKCDVLGVNTLEVIAAQSPPEVSQAWAVMDAQRQQLFVAHYARQSDGNWQADGAAAIEDNDSWLAQLQPGDFVIGPGLARVFDSLPAEAQVADRSLWEPQAATVAKLALRDFAAGRREELWHLTPVYLRESAAEEKLK